MQTNTVEITLSSALYNQLSRLKAQGNFESEQDLLQAAFEALDREWQRSRETPVHFGKPYMARPGLSPDDYDL